MTRCFKESYGRGVCFHQAKPNLGVDSTIDEQEGDWRPMGLQDHVSQRGTSGKHKVRLVAKDYSQRPVLDYNDTFAPSAKMTTIRTVFALASIQRWPVYQMDVKLAFLNDNLHEEIYVELHLGF